MRRGKLGSPTTVRFPEDLMLWLQSVGAKHQEGIAGVIREAVAEKRERAKEERAAPARVRKSILSSME